MEMSRKFKNYLLVDFEFTNYNRLVGRPSAFFSEIIEIGAVLLDGESFKEIARYQSFVKPRFFPKQAKDSMDFCMITEKDMKKAAELLREILTAQQFLTF